jgi:hypothetical protein
MKLFAIRAAAIRPGFAISDEQTAWYVADVCRRLDGLPLAIELAAARTSVLSPAALAGQLGNSLDSLGDGPRDLPSRQRTLRTALDWSYSLLTDPARGLLPRMAVCYDGTAELIAAVGGPYALRALESLIEHSLVQTHDVHGERRFAMLETTREYARERLFALGETTQARQRHAEYFLDLAEAAEPALLGTDQLAWLNRLKADRDNLTAALRWARDHGAWELGLRLVSALWWFWSYHGSLQTGREWIEELLTAADGQASKAVLARALGVAGWLNIHQGDTARARQQCERALVLAELSGSAWGSAFALTGLGAAGLLERDPDRSRLREVLEDACIRWQRLDDSYGFLMATAGLGALALNEGDLARAQPLLSRFLDTARGIDGPYSIAYACRLLGMQAQDYGTGAALVVAGRPPHGAGSSAR